MMCVDESLVISMVSLVFWLCTECGGHGTDSFDLVSFDYVPEVWHDGSVLRAPFSSFPGAVTGAFGAGGDLRRLVTLNGRIMVANRTILDLRSSYSRILVFGVVGSWSFHRRPMRVWLANLHSW